MHKKLTLIFLVSASFLFGQQPSTRFGDISDVEWEMQYCDFDSTAAAVILMEQCNIHFSGGKAYLKTHRRIKILDERGFENGNIEIPYYHYDHREWIAGFKGVTYFRDEHGKVEKLNIKEEFKEKINDYWSVYKVPFPAIRKGAIIEYRYEFVTNNLFSLEPWAFQHEIPTVYSFLAFELPPYLQYSILGFGARYQAKYDQKDRKEWVLERLPGYKDEDFVYNPKDYIDQVRFQAFSQLTNQGWQEIVKDWKALGADMLKDHYLRVFKKAARKTEILEEILEGGESQNEKVKKIYEFVRNTYGWNGYYSIYPGKTFDDLLTTKTGNIAEINLWLIGLLKAAGVEADPVLLSTRTNGKPVKNFPLLNQFNNVICAVNSGREVILMDAVGREHILPYDLLPPEDLNYIGLRIQPDETNWIDIPFSENNKSQTLVELDLGKGTGTMKLHYEGYKASEKRVDLARGKPLFDKVVFENFSGEEMAVEQTGITEAEDPDKSLDADYELDLADIAAQDVIYFTPAVWTNLKEIPFKKQERSLPVELPYPFTYQVAVKIILPEGYQLQEAPENLSLSLPGQSGNFSYSVNNMETFVLISIRLKISWVYLTPGSYFDLREFYEIISQKVSEALVIVRK